MDASLFKQTCINDTCLDDSLNSSLNSVLNNSLKNIFFKNFVDFKKENSAWPLVFDTFAFLLPSHQVPHVGFCYNVE